MSDPHLTAKFRKFPSAVVCLFRNQSNRKTCELTDWVWGELEKARWIFRFGKEKKEKSKKRNRERKEKKSREIK